MSRRHRTDNRDANEQAIVDALEAAGASVSRLDGKDGEPDLLVGFCCITDLMEVKNPTTGTGKTHAGASKPNRGGDGISTGPQLEWRKAWKGRPAVIVASPREALSAIGIVTDAEMERILAVAAEAAQKRVRRRKMPSLVTTSEAREIQRIDPAATDPDGQRTQIRTCGERTGHARVIQTKFCACTHAMY